MKCNSFACLIRACSAGMMMIGLLSTEARSATVKPAAENLTVSQPYRHENLTIWFLSGKDFTDTRKILTLSEALEKKLAKVHETGEVNELAIENLSPGFSIFLQAGDIVKGGKQDRAIATDFIMRPRSGRVPIASFCVEQSRWTNRGRESATEFSSSLNSVADKNLKMALRKEKDQGKVWENVESSQEKMTANAGVPVESSASPSSMQLALENKEIKKISQTYLNALKAGLEKETDALGYVYCINGKLNSAELYASHELLTRLWSKGLESAVIEAVSELNQQKHTKVTTEPGPAALKAKLIAAEKVKAGSELLFEDLWSVSAEGGDSLLFQTVEKSRQDLFMRRTYLWK